MKKKKNTTKPITQISFFNELPSVLFRRLSRSLLAAAEDGRSLRAPEPSLEKPDLSRCRSAQLRVPNRRASPRLVQKATKL